VHWQTSCPPYLHSHECAAAEHFESYEIIASSVQKSPQTVSFTDPIGMQRP